MEILVMFVQIFLAALIFLPSQGMSQLLINSFEPQDDTIVSGSTGVDAVDATLLKIGSVVGFGVELQNDFGFLKRIALVESNFGNATLQHQNRGIWQISPHILKSLSSIPPSVQRLVDALGQAFGNDAIDFTKEDFRVPLHSAVAARVFIEIQLSANSAVFPGSVNEQATWWATIYTNTTRNSSYYIDKVKAYEFANQCNVSRLDLWFLIDGSGSIGSNNFQTCLRFVNQTATTFNIAPDKVRTGLMIYSSSTTTRSLFNQHQSTQEFSRIVLSTSYPRGGTRTGSAINQTAFIGFNEANGARPRENGVPRILVVLTDGRSGDSVVEASKYIKMEGVTVFGVGVGSGFNKDEVDEIASIPKSAYAFALNDFLALSAVLQDSLINQACYVPAVVPEGSNVSFVYQPGSISYSQVDLPDNGSLELTFNIKATTSVCVVYVSVSVANPGPALYDARFEISVGVTVAYYNVDAISPGTQRKKRQIDSGNRPSTLYLGFETRGTEPISLGFTTTDRSDYFESETTIVAEPTTTEITTTAATTSTATTAATTSTATTATTISITTTSGVGSTKETGNILLTLLNLLMLFWMFSCR